MMTFYEFMTRYRGKDTPRGDLAFDMAHDKDFPKEATSRERIRHYLVFRNACSECLQTFSRCWRSYQKFLAKEACKT